YTRKRGVIMIEQNVKKRDLPLIVSFLLPGLVIFAVVIVIPTILAIDYSFYKAESFVGEPTFVGFDNYVNIFRDVRFWRDLGKTFVYAGASVVLQTIVGIAIALVLNQSFKGNSILRGISVVPYIVPVIVVTIGWEWMLDVNNGIINHWIAGIGLDKI